MELALLDELTYACREDCDDQTIQGNHKREEKSVVATTYACAEPHAMMIELTHTVIAQITVCGLMRSENEARLTKLHRCECSIRKRCTIHRLTLFDEVKYSVFFELDIHVFFVDVVPCIFGVKGTRDDSWVDSTCYEHQCCAN